MKVQQILLTSVSSILITISLYYFFLSMVISHKQKRYLYFSISNFGGFLFSLAALLLTLPFLPSTLLWIHRVRMLGLMIGTTAWLYCTYEIYFKGSRVPHIQGLICLLFLVILPTPWFLRLPIHVLQTQLAGIPFTYFLASAQPAYSLYAGCLLAFFCYSFLRVALSQNLGISKSFGLIAFFPGIVGGLNDYAVSHGLLHTIMISEYLISIYLFSVFFLFLRQDKMDYQLLHTLNQKLEEEVLHRTAELTTTHHQLKLKIAAQFQSEADIKRAKEFLDKIIETSQDSIIMVDNKGIITRVNTAFLELLGYASSQVVGKPMEAFVPHLPGAYQSTTGEWLQLAEADFKERKEKLATMRQTGELENWTTYYLRHDNKIVPMEANAIVINNEKNQPLVSVGVLRDITELKKASQTAIESEKMAAVGRLAGGIAHDFNNLLCIILGNISMAKEDVPDDTPAAKILMEGENAVQQATNLISQFISFSTQSEPDKNTLAVPIRRM